MAALPLLAALGFLEALLFLAVPDLLAAGALAAAEIRLAATDRGAGLLGAPALLAAVDFLAAVGLVVGAELSVGAELAVAAGLLVGPGRFAAGRFDTVSLFARVTRLAPVTLPPGAPARPRLGAGLGPALLVPVFASAEDPLLDASRASRMLDASSAAKVIADTTAPALRASFIILPRRCLRRRKGSPFRGAGPDRRVGRDGRAGRDDPFRRAEATPVATLAMAPERDRRGLDRPPFLVALFPNAATRAVGVAAALALLFFMGTPFSCVPP